MHRLACLLGLLLVLWVALSWCAPGVLPGFLAPGVPGLDPGYEVTYAAWSELEAARPAEALEATDEFLLGPGASGPDARSVWAMRDQALRRGGGGVDSPAARGQLWRLRRVAARRPVVEWIGLVTALGLFAGAWLSSRQRQPILVDMRPGVGPRPWQNLPPPQMD
jgi:hypothetical protein